MIFCVKVEVRKRKEYNTFTPNKIFVIVLTLIRKHLNLIVERTVFRFKIAINEFHVLIASVIVLCFAPGLKINFIVNCWQLIKNDTLLFYLAEFVVLYELIE